MSQPQGDQWLDGSKELGPHHAVQAAQKDTTWATPEVRGRVPGPDPPSWDQANPAPGRHGCPTSEPVFPSRGTGHDQCWPLTNKEGQERRQEWVTGGSRPSSRTGRNKRAAGPLVRPGQAGQVTQAQGPRIPLGPA